MPRDDGSIWRTVGRTVEAARSRVPGDRSRRRKGREESTTLPAVLGRIASEAAESTLRRRLRTRRPPLYRLLRGAAAGVGAAGVVFALRLLAGSRTGGVAEELDESPVRELADELLAGAGRGIVYAALLDPYIPGPALFRGALVGTAEYMAAPWGGLFYHLQALSPVRRVPVVSILLETGEAEEDPFPAFLAYGAALGLLYGSGSDPD